MSCFDDGDDDFDGNVNAHMHLENLSQSKWTYSFKKQNHIYCVHKL